jgi:hypothetical protein
MTKNKKIIELFEILHFGENLEDVNKLYMLKPKSLERWCKTHGEKLHQISFSLACEGNIDFILDKLKSKN